LYIRIGNETIKSCHRHHHQQQHDNDLQMTSSVHAVDDKQKKRRADTCVSTMTDNCNQDAVICAVNLFTCMHTMASILMIIPLMLTKMMMT